MKPLSETDKIVWGKCLRLWEAMSIRPDEMTGNRYPEGFKNYILQQLGIETKYIMCGCPLCEEYLKDEGCKKCPVSINTTGEDFACELVTPYKEYVDIFYKEYTSKSKGYNLHSQEEAEDFYIWLIDLAKSVGYEPDFKLRFW